MTTQSVIRLHMDRTGIQVDGPDWLKKRIRSLAWDARQAKVEFFITGDELDKPAQQDQLYWQLWDARNIPEEIRDEVNPETHPDNPGILVAEVKSFAEANGFLIAIAYLMPEEQSKGAFYWYGPLRRQMTTQAGSARVYQTPPPPPGSSLSPIVRALGGPISPFSNQPMVFHRDNLIDLGYDVNDPERLRRMGIVATEDEGVDRPGGEPEAPPAPTPAPGGSEEAP